jgi:MazG family protein
MSNIEKLLEIMAALRHPQTGCPWDLQQDFASIAPYTIEEAYEVADAIARDDLDGLRDELGDLLLQVVFHAQLAKERAAFDFHEVAGGIVEKMRRRHPHVFGNETERRAGMQAGSWEAIKAGERRRSASAREAASTLDGVARALPALMRAQKLGKRAARVGFDWPDAGGAWSKIDEEMAELREAEGRGDARHIAEELGDLLFAVVNLARHLEIDAEQALASAGEKFERRFRRMEQSISQSGATMPELALSDLEEHWLLAKRDRGPDS